MFGGKMDARSSDPSPAGAPVALARGAVPMKQMDLENSWKLTWMSANWVNMYIYISQKQMPFDQHFLETVFSDKHTFNIIKLCVRWLGHLKEHTVEVHE